VCFSDILPELSNEAENAAALALALTGLLSRILEHDPAQDEPELNRPAGTLSKPTRSQMCAHHHGRTEHVGRERLRRHLHESAMGQKDVQNDGYRVNGGG
jgi:hypothetical protein